MKDNIHPTMRSVLAGIYNTIQESIDSPLRMSETESETKIKLDKAVEKISNALQELDGVSELLNDFGLEYSYTDIDKAVGLLEKCFKFAEEERKNK